MCQEIWTACQKAGLPEKYADLRARLAKGRTLLKRLQDGFPQTDAGWRWLLFDKVALGLKPIAWTPKKREPQVSDEVIERLAIKHPNLEVLRYRVEIQHAQQRLRGPLAVEPDADGKVRFSYSLHRTATGRIASGSDDADPDKFRDSAGNGQNLSEDVRSMYIASPGYVILQADWSQVEARVLAWLANEEARLEAWASGGDVYEIAAKVIAKALGRGEVDYRRDTFQFEGRQQTFRQAGKKLDLALGYGMGPVKMGRLYGLTGAQATAIHGAWHSRNARISAYQRAVAAKALSDGYLTNPFGARLPCYRERSRDGQAELADREAALAFPAQSSVACMIQAVLKGADSIEGAVLDNTVHDSLRWVVAEANTEQVAAAVRSLMERPWPQLGTHSKYDEFRAPVKLSVGSNWGEWDERTNSEGLRELGILEPYPPSPYSNPINCRPSL